MSDLPEWLETALDVGVYPASGPGERVRTPYEDGYNDAVFEITERVERAWIENGNGLQERLRSLVANARDHETNARRRRLDPSQRSLEERLWDVRAKAFEEAAVLSGESGDNRYAWCEACGYAHPVDDPDCLQAHLDTDPRGYIPRPKESK